MIELKALYNKGQYAVLQPKFDKLELDEDIVYAL